MLNWGSLSVTVPIMFYGLCGIFLVIGIIALAIMILGKIFVIEKH